MNQNINVLPGLWREAGSLVRLDTPAITSGMVVVGRDGEVWRERPELRWQTWPDLLEPMAKDQQ